MKRKVIIIGSAAVLAVLFTITAFSQGPDRKETRQKVKQYAKENILPVVSEEREKFDNELSSQEKQKVDELRERMLALKEEGKEFREMHRGRRGHHERPDLTDEQKEQMFQHKKEMRLIRTEAFEIIDAHEDYLKSLRQSMEPQMESWKEEIKEIIGENSDRRGPDSEGEFRGHHGKRGRGHHGRHGGMFKELHSPVGFLLMDPSNPIFPEEELRTSSSYPNPSNGFQTLELDLKKSGKVKVDLYDNKGNFVKSLFDGELQEGEQKLELNLGDLPSQQYLYKIKSPNGKETKRVIIE